MMQQVPVYVGLRYLRARGRNHFVSFVTGASVAGVALGVAALIVVLSVMNGFEGELRDRLLRMTAHGAINGGVIGLPAEVWPGLAAELAEYPGVVAVAPYVELEAMLSGRAGMAGAIVTGIDPAAESMVSGVAQNMVSGSLSDIDSAGGSIILGRALAARLGVGVGDSVTVLVPQPPARGRGVTASSARLQVSGMFELGVQDHDAGRALISLREAARLGHLGNHISGLRILTDDILAAPDILGGWLAQRGSALPPNVELRDWTMENAIYFRAIRIEKTMMMLLLSLIIGVAAFNILASLVMVVTEKRGGIAILRTLGCSRSDIIKVFVLQGTIIGWSGALLGVALGVLLTLNIGTVAPALEEFFGFRFMPADLYYLTALPSELRAGDVAWTAFIVLVITSLATIYPARRAAAVDPAEVLRYE